MDAVEDVLEQVGRFAKGKVSGVTITVSVQKILKYPVIRPPRPCWKIAVDTTLYGSPRNVRYFDDKAEATAEFDALVAKYNLTEER